VREVGVDDAGPYCGFLSKLVQHPAVASRAGPPCPPAHHVEAPEQLLAWRLHRVPASRIRFGLRGVLPVGIGQDARRCAGSGEKFLDQQVEKKNAERRIIEPLVPRPSASRAKRRPGKTSRRARTAAHGTARIGANARTRTAQRGNILRPAARHRAEQLPEERRF